jgi:hypothetical protein
MIPIIAQARESTSYKIIKKQLDSLADRFGYTYELVEEGTYDVGEDVMHKIKLVPRRKEDALGEKSRI